MDTSPPPVDAHGVQYEEMSPRGGHPSAWSMDLIQLSFGALTVTLATSPRFAEGKAAFSTNAARYAFGAAGAIFLFLAVRGFVRAVRNERKALTPEVHRKAKVRGRVVIAAGAALFAMALSDPVAEQTVTFYGWVKPFYVVAALYLLLIGLLLQWNPTRTLRQQRIARGEGRPGVARIVQASDTGASVNDAPRVRIDFELEVAGRTYEVSDKIVMERAKLALLIPGSTVNVLVDRVDPNVFRIDWASWKAPGPS